MSKEMKKSERLCWWCENLYYRNQEEDWSEVTPGSNMQILCIKGKFPFAFDPYRTSLDEFRTLLETAKKCPAFQMRKDITGR